MLVNNCRPKTAYTLKYNAEENEKNKMNENKKKGRKKKERKKRNSV